MEWQAVVVEVQRGRMLVQPLDGVQRVSVKVPRCDRLYVEGELLRLAPVRRGKLAAEPIKVEVLGSSMDPSYLGGEAPALEGGEDGEYWFAERDDEAIVEALVAAMELGTIRAARKVLLELAARDPLHIDVRHHLGNLAYETGNPELALKHYELAYAIGRLALPPGFAGRLPWGHLSNRPFLRACHGRALMLMEPGRVIEAGEALAELLRFNPDDNQGVRYLLPDLLLRSGAWAQAREALDQAGVDGTNLYTRCLVDVEAGRRRDALRWLCTAVSYNPYVPGLLVRPQVAADSEAPGARYVTMGGPDEAAEYVRHHASYWRAGKGSAFLRRVLALPPFETRLARLFEIDRLLGGLPPGAERSRLVSERSSLFGDDAAPGIAAECAALL